jgi:hypothetical protein
MYLYTSAFQVSQGRRCQLPLPSCPFSVLCPFHNCTHSLQTHRTLLHLLIDSNQVMIRLPPSAISLGSTDLRDFETRQRQRQDLEAQGKLMGSKEHSSLQMVLTIRTATHPISHSDLGHSGDGESRGPDSSASSLTDTEYPTFTDLAEDQDGYRSTGNHSSPENALIISQPSSPFKIEFHSVDFSESPARQTVVDASQPSPFSIPLIFHFRLQPALTIL